jgi:hypothetical protein
MLHDAVAKSDELLGLGWGAAQRALGFLCAPRGDALPAKHVAAGCRRGAPVRRQTQGALLRRGRQ